MYYNSDILIKITNEILIKYMRHVNIITRIHDNEDPMP